MVSDASAAAALQARLGEFRPRLLLTLGSGLGALADEIDAPVAVAFAEAGLPPARVPGHAGRLVAGALHGLPVLVQQGRVHLYEGVSAAQVVACVRAAAALGADTFVVTNAAGGLSDGLAPGDLLVLTDHLNLTGATPLIDPGCAPQFVDLADAYDPVLRRLAHAAAADVGQRLVDAVYAGLVGPAYETRAEVRMLRTLGADAVGMSTVLEVIAARAAGLRVLGLSVVTNVHRLEGSRTEHGDVLAVARDGGRRLAAVLRALLPRLVIGGSPAGP